MSKVIGLILLGLIAYYWSLTQKLKAIALLAARQRCREAGVQLLDHTVVLFKIRPIFDAQRRLRLERDYRFEFTSTGEHRYSGKIIVQGNYVVASELDAFSIN